MEVSPGIDSQCLKNVFSCFSFCDTHLWCPVFLSVCFSCPTSSAKTYYPLSLSQCYLLFSLSLSLCSNLFSFSLSLFPSVSLSNSLCLLFSLSVHFFSPSLSNKKSLKPRNQLVVMKVLFDPSASKGRLHRDLNEHWHFPTVGLS